MPSEPLNKIYHVLNIPEREQQFITEKVDDLRHTWMLTKAIRAGGEAAKGILSNPSLAFLVAGGILAGLGAYVGKDAVESLQRYFGAVSRAISPEATEEEKQAAVSDMGTQLEQIIRFFAPTFGL